MNKHRALCRYLAQLYLEAGARWRALGDHLPDIWLLLDISLCQVARSQTQIQWQSGVMQLFQAKAVLVGCWSNSVGSQYARTNCQVWAQF